MSKSGQVFFFKEWTVPGWCNIQCKYWVRFGCKSAEYPRTVFDPAGREPGEKFAIYDFV
jgi:hypothetical protein